METAAVVVDGRCRLQDKPYVVFELLDKIRWICVRGVYYVHPEHLTEFIQKHGPLDK